MPQLAAAKAANNAAKFSEMIDWGLRLVVLLSVPSAVALITFAQPLVSVIFHIGLYTDMDVAQTTLALMGFVSGCPILSIMAWVMGNGDLREMREGRMDPEGQGLTYAGYVLGMILSFVWVLAAVVGLFIVLVVAANN